jgi:WD40 repeat protein
MRWGLYWNRQIWAKLLSLLIGIGSVMPAHTQLWMKGGHGRPVWQTIFSGDQRFLLSAGTDNTIKVWNAQRSSPRFGHLLGSVRAHVAGVSSIAEYNGLVVSGGGASDNQVKLWRLTSNGKLNFVRSWTTPNGYGVSAVAFTNWIVNNATKRIIVAGSYGGFFLIDQDSGATLWYRFPWMPGEPIQWVQP